MEGKSTLNQIDTRIKKAKKALKQFGYDPTYVSAKEFYDYMTGEIFSDDPTTLRDVLGNEYIMIHELVEIGELENWKENRQARSRGNAKNPLLRSASYRNGDRTKICSLQRRHVLGEN
jgi:hypothetical protein